jgi:thiamine-phosphate pyrophosphorylase
MSSTFLNALGNTRLYPITDRSISGRSHAEQVLLLSEAGINLVQLRDKVLSPQHFYQQAAEALHLARDRGVKIIINDRVDIALALKADGVHLGQDDMSPESARRLLGPEAIIGFSTHDIEQARLGSEMPVDYIAIGPIFETSSKEAPDFPLGLEKLRQVRQAVGQMPLVAIGGLGIDNARQVLGTGVDALAIISDIWCSPGRELERARQLINAI